jgi:hypothetical protein
LKLALYQLSFYSLVVTVTSYVSCTACGANIIPKPFNIVVRSSKVIPDIICVNCLAKNHGRAPAKNIASAVNEAVKTVNAPLAVNKAAHFYIGCKKPQGQTPQIRSQ